MFRIKQLATFLLAATLIFGLAGGPALAAISLVNNVDTGFVNQPTGTISTTGASLAVACVAGDQGQGTGQTVGDDRGNTWARVATPLVLGGIHVELWYALITSPNASTAIQYSGNFSYIAVASFSGTATSSVKDGSPTGATAAFATSVQPGSITPSQANGLLISCFGANPSSGTPNVNSSFTKTDDISTADVIGGLAYLVQTTATAVNPTWDNFTMTAAMASMQAFKDPGGAPPPPANRFIMTGTTP